MLKIATAQSTIMLRSRVSCFLPHPLKGPNSSLHPLVLPSQRAHVAPQDLFPIFSTDVKAKFMVLGVHGIIRHLPLPGNLCIYTRPNPEEGLRGGISGWLLNTYVGEV